MCINRDELQVITAEYEHCVNRRIHQQSNIYQILINKMTNMQSITLVPTSHLWNFEHEYIFSLHIYIYV